MGEACTGCGERTCYCCSDCAIDGAGKIYVCIKDACRTEHEKKHIQEPVSMETLLSEVRGAVARGWCADANQHKVMDSDLAEAIAQEVMLLLPSGFVPVPYPPPIEGKTP